MTPSDAGQKSEAKPTFTIDGRRIHDISSFYAELNRVFMQDVGWRLGASLDALNDLLHGGYGALHGVDEAEIDWLALEETRQALGLSATRAWLRAKLGHGSFSQAAVEEQLAELEAGWGPTYFDLVLEVFGDHPQWRINPVPAEEDAFGQHVRTGCGEARALADRMSDGEINAVLPLIRRLWIETEAPSACSDAWTEIWSEVGRAPNPALVMRAGDRRKLAALGPRVQVFRGALQGNERGWSWTLDRAVAEDFGRRYDDEGSSIGDGVLCTTEVPRDAILALFSEGDETEVILNPAELTWGDVSIEPLGDQSYPQL
ncbi:MAG: hypothetical protein Q4G35_02945 [Propionibacteriaceae bacterium]|nr:hypothetical protein [Propionibacteriaceae bacterium]